MRPDVSPLPGCADELLNAEDAEPRRRRGLVDRSNSARHEPGFLWEQPLGLSLVASRAVVPKKSSSGLVVRGTVCAFGAPPRLCSSAPLRLCASAPLRLCASAPLRQVVQQGVPIQELIAKRTTIRERKSRTRKIDWPADPWMPRTDGPTKLAEPAFYAFVSIHPVNCWFALSRSGTGKATRVPYEPFLKNVPLGYALSCDRPY